MKKRGQITLFIILGIVILLVVSLLVVLPPKQELKAPEELVGIADPIKIFVDSCIERAAENGLYAIALQGGYYDVPQLNRFYAYINIPYYWYNHSNDMPSIEVIEQELSKYIVDKLPECTLNFKFFEEQGYSFEIGGISSDARITPRNVVVDIKYPIIVRKESSTIQLEDFAVPVDINFNRKYNIVKQFMDEQGENPDSIPIGFLSDLAYRNNFTFEDIHLGNGEVLFTFIFEEKFREPILYAFWNTYNWSESIAPLSFVTIEPIPPLTITEPKPFEYHVNATGNNLTFYDYTNLFNIEPKTGWIRFDPSNIPNGKRNILIKAVDESGNAALTIMRIEIKRAETT